MKILGCKADAEDIVQETFIKWLNAEQENIRNTKAYLIKALRNNCINHLQSLKKKKEEYLENLHWPEFIERFRDTDFTCPDLEVQMAKALHVIHTKLEPLERAVYLLKEVFDFDYKALQDVLDKKQDHCRQLLCRAKRKLHDGKDNLALVINPKRTALLESFRKACDFDNASELIEQLRTDIKKTLS